ncbi:hypothetical protein CBER1_03627 [Cercospora berteroae]|uniref:Uncharacterized protein n=1 Tax=Cercospora berteroae TaxID=357750 RepID=A0A2S6CLN0_9PEZI|nr:hypothetical protein CBER1_03627 [Cercospora berteroae]
MAAPGLFNEIRAAQATVAMLIEELTIHNRAYTTADEQVQEAEQELHYVQRTHGYNVRGSPELSNCIDRLNLCRQHLEAVQEHLLHLWRELEGTVHAKRNLWAEIEDVQGRIKYPSNKIPFVQEKVILQAEDRPEQEAYWRKHMFGKTRPEQDRSEAEEENSRRRVDERARRDAEEERLRQEEAEEERRNNARNQQPSPRRRPFALQPQQPKLAPLVVNPVALRQWQLYVTQSFSNYALINGFPDPCSGPLPVVTPCAKPQCNREERTLVACSCQLRKTFEAAGVNLKKELHRWHPDRFHVCAEQRRPLYILMATEVFRVLNEMREEALSRGL